MTGKNLVAALTFLMMTGCSGYAPPRYDPTLYPHSHRFYDLTLFWNVTREGTTVTIPGFVKNTRFAYVKDLELTGTLLDEEGSKLGEATYYFFPRLIEMDEVVPFTLKMVLKEERQAAKVRFFYRYRLPAKDYGDSPYSYS